MEFILPLNLGPEIRNAHENVTVPATKEAIAGLKRLYAKEFKL